MNNVKYPYILFLILASITSCNESIDIDECSGFEHRVYEYPEYECTEADSVDCYQKKLKSLLLPDQYLKCSFTDSLSQTCLNYPYMSIIWAYNSLQQGFDYIVDIFNGFGELFNRDNANIELIKIYQQMDPDSIYNISESAEIGKFMAQFTFIEITLSQYMLINKLTHEEVNTLLNLCLEQYYKKSNISSFGWIGEMSTLAIMARVLESIDYEPFMEEFMDNIYLKSFIIKADFGGFDINKIEEITQLIVTNSESYMNYKKSTYGKTY